MKLDASSLVANKAEIEVPNGAETLKLYVSELGYMQTVNMSTRAKDMENPNVLAMMIVEAVTDKDGNHFTLEEVLNLKKEVAKPIFDAVIKINKLAKDDAEKN